MGIGGDPVNGLKHVDVLKMFNDDPETIAVIMIGEIGGTDEEAAAEWVKANMKKPVVGFIAGVTAPPGKRMGHAGAIISGGKGTAQEKLAVMEASGIKVTKNPAEMGKLLQACACSDRMESMTDPNAWIALATLTALEIVLGVDNIIFISILVGRLPEEQRDSARRLGLALAMGTRIAAAAVARLDHAADRAAVHDLAQGISGRDLILIFGGLFLLWKSVHEIHGSLEGEPRTSERAPAPRAASFAAVLVQIAVIDIVFSLDSVITAVGMVDEVDGHGHRDRASSVGVMMFAAKPIGEFVDRHPTVKMLALAFLVLVGVALIAEGFDMHVPEGLHLLRDGVLGGGRDDQHPRARGAVCCEGTNGTDAVAHVSCFVITIVAVVANWIDSTAAALVGVAVMIWMGVMTEIDAFKLVDWNVMAILVGIWIIAGYFGKIGRAELAVGAGAQALRRAARAARHDPVVPRRRHLDVRRQRRDDPHDGAGRAAARARAGDPGVPARPDDRSRRELHGFRPHHRRPAAADAAQRRRRRVLRLHLAPGPAVVVPDPDGDVRRDARRHVVVRLSRRGRARVRSGSLASTAHIPDRLFATIAVGMFLLTVVGDVDARAPRRAARADRA